MKGSVTVLALLIGCTFLQAQQLRVPYDASSVMINGKVENNEWDHALKLVVNDSTNLYIKQDQENIYWCLHTRGLRPELMMVDFYFLQEEEKLTLHASAKLGERRWANGSYGEWIWWNNAGWQANVARMEDNPRGKFLYDDAKEFQLRKERFVARSFRLMFDVSYPENMLMNFPVGSNEENTEGWLQFAL